MAIEYTVQQGDCFSSIARSFGFRWKQLWDLNPELQKKRGDPNVLFPGDIVKIPDQKEGQESGGTDQRHTFKLLGEKTVLQIRLLANGKPRKNLPCQLTVDGVEQQGTFKTDGDAHLTHNGSREVPIPGKATSAVLLAGQPPSQTTHRLALGGLDPVTELRGLQQRLSNLGFDSGPNDGHWGGRTRKSVVQFQNAYGLDVSGVPDAATQQKLHKVHGGKKSAPTQKIATESKDGQSDNDGTPVAKQSLGSETTVNTIDTAERIYVNAGCWGPGHTDFMVVSNADIVMGSWGNFKRKASGQHPVKIDELDGHPVRRFQVAADASPAVVKQLRESFLTSDNCATKIVNYFNQAPDGADGRARAYPLAHFRSRGEGFRFTKENELIVFVGDMHVHFFKRWLCDNFVVDKHQNVRRSLATEFKQFIDHSLSHAGGKPNVIQVGDMYEVWETQQVFEHAFSILEDFIQGMPEYSYFDDFGKVARSKKSWMRTPFPWQLLADKDKYKDLANNLFDGPATSIFSSSKESDRSKDQKFSGARPPYNEAQIVLLRYFGISGSGEFDLATKWRTEVTPRDALALLYFRHPRKLDESASPGGESETPYTSGSGSTKGEVDVANAAVYDRLATGNEPMAFTDSAAIIQRIRKEYESDGLTTAFWESFTSIEGNHDRLVPNDWLDTRFPPSPTANATRLKNIEELEDREAPYEGKSEWDPKATLENGPPKGISVSPKMSFRRGPTNPHGSGQQIVYEHGDAFDQYNIPGNFFLKSLLPTGGGWFGAYNWVLNELCADNATMGTKGFFADPALVRYANARMKRIFFYNSEVRLVVLGHTHEAELRDFNKTYLEDSNNQVLAINEVEIEQGKTKNHDQDNVDRGVYHIRCLSGSIHVQVQAAVWKKFETFASESKVLAAGETHKGTIKELSKYFFDQTNRIRVRCIKAPCRYSIAMNSSDRPPIEYDYRIEGNGENSGVGWEP
jgi:hypothetical protein